MSNNIDVMLTSLISVFDKTVRASKISSPSPLLRNIALFHLCLDGSLVGTLDTEADSCESLLVGNMTSPLCCGSQRKVSSPADVGESSLVDSVDDGHSFVLVHGFVLL